MTLTPLHGEHFNQPPAPARHCLFSSSSSFRQLSNARRRSGATHRRVIVGYCISSSRLLRATLSPLDFLHCIARSWTTWIRRVTRVRDVSVCQDSLMDDDGCDDGFILSASLANNNVRAGIARYKARKSRRRRYRRARLVNFNIIFQQWRADVMVYIRRRRRRHIWRLTPLGVSPRGGSCGLTTTPGSGVQLRARITV